MTALISGDLTRRNIPGEAFRRAKARLLKRGAAVGLAPTKGQQGGDGLQHKDVEQQDLGGGFPPGLGRLELVSELSRVSEEGSEINRARTSSRSLGGGGRNLDSVDGSGRRESAFGEGSEAADGGVDTSGRSRDLPRPPSNPGVSRRRKKSKGHRDSSSGGGDGVESKTPSGPGAEKRADEHDEPYPGAGWPGARSPFHAGDDNMWPTAAEQEDGDGYDSESRSALSTMPQGEPPAPRSRRETAARSRPAGGGGQAGNTTRSGIRLADSIRAAGADRGRWTWGKKTARAEKRKSAGVGRGDRSHVLGGKNAKVDSVELSSGDDQPRATVSGARRKAKRGSSKTRPAMRTTGPTGESPLDDVSGRFVAPLAN